AIVGMFEGERIYVDDGNVIYSVVERLKNKSSSKEFTIFPYWKGLFMKVLGYDIKIRNNNVTLFTYYYGKIREKLSDFDIQIDQNNFTYLKKNQNRLELDDNVVYFIGTALCSNSIIEENYFKSLILRIAEYYKDKHVVYFSHRAENSDTLKIIEQVGWEVSANQLPIELSVIRRQTWPTEFGVFFSSAVDTLNDIYTINSFKAFLLKEEEIIDDGHKKNIRNVYNAYRDYANLRLISIG
ncbi:hypothetical protein, partial [Robertkochia marina]